MPPLKQPLKLQEICLKETSIWLDIVGHNLMSYIYNLSQIDHRMSDDQLEEVVDTAHGMIEKFVPYTLYEELSVGVIAVIGKLGNRCKETINLKIDMCQYLCKVESAIFK